MEPLRHPEGNSHGNHREGGSDQSGREDEKKLAENEMHARDGAGENRFHRAALLFSGGKINSRIHGPLKAENNDEIAEESADGGPANFFWRSHVFLFNLERIQH